MQFAGISPTRVAKKKCTKGTPIIGLDILISQLGTIGVILKNNK